MLKQIMYSPIWLFELFTTAKSFRNNPVIGSYWLNRMGLHVVRMVISHLIMYTRMWVLGWSLSAEDKKAFMRDGYLAKENFLSEEDWVAVRQEITDFDGEIREAYQGNTITQRSVLEPKVLAKMPALNRMVHNSLFQHLCSYTAGHLRLPLLYIETVKSQYVDAHKDPQKTLHSDTFHPSMKFWYFMNEVKPEQGPFAYIPGSHKLTWKRIKWEYKMSLKAKNLKDGMAAGGSFRFHQEDIEELGLAEPVSFTVKANTILFGNTFGVHRRGDTNGKAIRTAIWGDSRTNPFLPFPGIPGDWVNEMQYQFLTDFRRRADERAARAGVRPPWQIVEK